MEVAGSSPALVNLSLFMQNFVHYGMYYSSYLCLPVWVTFKSPLSNQYLAYFHFIALLTIKHRKRHTDFSVNIANKRLTELFKFMENSHGPFQMLVLTCDIYLLCLAGLISFQMSHCCRVKFKQSIFIYFVLIRRYSFTIFETILPGKLNSSGHRNLTRQYKHCLVSNIMLLTCQIKKVIPT